MSNRTAEASKAVLEAWMFEQELVKKGKGTRDWTKEQQQDILESGKAHDNTGRAFEGHHMKSAEMYPEFQGDSKNIQFLTRKEHFEAHGLNFQNPTNGMYNPILKETVDFPTNECVPCKVCDLSQPLVSVVKSDIASEVCSESKEKTPYNNSHPKKNVSEKNETVSHDALRTKLQTVQHTSFNGVKTNVKINPVKAITLAVNIGLWVAKALANNNEKRDVGYGAMANHYHPSKENDMMLTSHSSPTEHTVKGHTQRYHTKEGVIEKEKSAYKRGGKNKDT